MRVSQSSDDENGQAHGQAYRLDQWYPTGEPLRVQDLSISGHSGFIIGGQFAKGLKGKREFSFESVSEKEWGETVVRHTIKHGDAGKNLKIELQVQTKQETPGLPTFATSDRKLTVSN